MAPRRKKTYGMTPWGARLKDQLVSLGCRIERGEALARTGKVFDTVLRNGRMRTRVKGSSAPFYNVSLTFAPVPDEQRAAVQSAVAGDPLLTAEIVAGGLPLTVLERLEEAGVRILPEDFQELDGNCNCPDNMGGGGGFYGAKKRKGDPCKHQAACMFELIGELDKNPHTLLALRGIDVNEIIGVAEEGEGAVTAAESVGQIAYPLPTAAFGIGKGGKVEARSKGGMSFPQFQNSSRVILQSLAPNPAFSKDDFSGILATFYAALSPKKIAASAIGKTEAWEKKLDVDAVRPVLERAKFTLSFPDSFSVANVRVFIESDLWSLKDGVAGPDGEVKVERLKMAKREKKEDVVQVAKKEKKEDVVVKGEDFLVMDNGGVDANEGVEERDATLAAKTPEETLSTIPFEVAKPSNRDGVSPRVRITLDTFRRLMLVLPSDGSVGSPSFLFFFHCTRAALLMFSSSNMVPDVAPVGSSGAWTIIYRPFASCKAVAECMSRLQKLFPGDESCVRLRSKGDVEGAVMLEAKAGVLHSLCALLTHLVCEFNFNGGIPKNETRERAAFFGKNGTNATYQASTFSDKSQGLVVSRWLASFRLLSLETEILIKLDETVPGDPREPYSIELFFRDGGTAHRKAAASTLADPVREGWSDPTYLASGSPQSRDALKFVVALKNYIPDVGNLLKTGRSVIPSNSFETFVLEQSGVLRGLGATLLLPKGIKEVVQPRLVTQLSMKNRDMDTATWKKSYLQLASILQFDYRVMLGDESIDFDEFQRMVADGRRLCEFKGKFVELSPAAVKNIMDKKLSQPTRPENVLELLRDVISGDLKYSMSDMVAELIADLQRVERPAVPEALHAELRPYQVSGYQWILSNLRAVSGCALCDDMGLGKTIQAITCLLALNEAEYLSDSPALVVCPTSLLSNWTRELRKFAPSLSVQICAGPDRAQLINAAAGSKRKRRGSPHVILMSYGTVRQDVTWLSKFDFPLLIIDEAHIIKNQTAAVSKAVKKLGRRSSMRIALTGTIVENRLSELYSVFDFVLPGYLGKPKEFLTRFSLPIEKERDEEALALLRRMTAGFMLRREKTDSSIIQDLPEKVETKQYVVLAPEQVALYESVRQSMFDSIANAQAGPDGAGQRRSMRILKLLSDLKQVCNHPACYGDQPENVDPARSAKCTALFELLAPIIDSGEKVLIFSQYVKMIRILETQIAGRFGVRPLVFEGSLSRDKRDQVIRQFDSNPTRQVLLLSLKAGGVGLNLVKANHVVMFDRWWNNAAEAQAIDRAFRIGQTKNVFVHKLVCSDTFEEKIDAMVEAKKEIANLTTETGETWIGKMSDDELNDLFSLSKSMDSDEQTGVAQ